MRDKQRLSKVADIIMGQSPDSNYCNDKGIGLPFLQGCGEFGKKYPVIKNYCTVPKKKSPVHSILISVRAPVGDLNIASQTVVIGRGLSGIVPKNIDKDFLFHSIVQFKNQLRRLAQGTTFEAINSKDLQNFSINYFPADHQRKIAKILNTIDVVIEKTEVAIAKYKAVKQGMMQDLFTRGIDPKTGKLRPGQKDAPELYKETELGWIPKEWEVTTLGEIGYFSKGNNIPKSQLSHSGAGCIVYGQIYTTYNDNVVEVKSKIPFELAQEMKKLKKGDILFAGSGETHEEIGKCIAYQGTETVYPGGDIVILSLYQNQISSFFGYYLNHFSIQRQKSRLGQGSSVIHIYSSHLKRVFIALPTRDEQLAISDQIRIIDQLLKKEQTNLSKHQSLKKGLMQDLLTGRVEVEV